MTIAKTLIDTLVTISKDVSLTNNERYNKAWRALEAFDSDVEDKCSGSTSEYIYTFDDNSKVQYLSYDEGDGSDISFSCEDDDELTAYFMTEYEDFDDWDYSWTEEE